MTALPQVASLQTRDLLRLHGAILAELRERGVVRTGNSPLGDYAEQLFAGCFGWTLAGNANQGFDALDGTTRYQIKARRITARNPSRQLSFIRRLFDDPFDHLAACLFGEDYRIIRAVILPLEVVQQRATPVRSVNGWRLMLTDCVCDDDRVSDVSPRMGEYLHQAENAA